MSARLARTTPTTPGVRQNAARRQTLRRSRPRPVRQARLCVAMSCGDGSRPASFTPLSYMSRVGTADSSSAPWHAPRRASTTPHRRSAFRSGKSFHNAISYRRCSWARLLDERTDFRGFGKYDRSAVALHAGADDHRLSRRGPERARIRLEAQVELPRLVDLAVRSLHRVRIAAV